MKFQDSGKMLSVSQLSYLSNAEKLSIAFGIFDVVHPGHLRYLESAKKHGEKLVVMVLSSLNGWRSEPEFSAQDRINGILALRIVDYVVCCEVKDVKTIIESLEPGFNFIVGSALERDFGELGEQLVIEIGKAGGAYIQHRGAYPLDSIFDQVEAPLARKIAEREEKYVKICTDVGLTKSRLLEIVDTFKKTKLLVIGDVILDRYVSCEALGMSAEAPVIVLQEGAEKYFLGGAGIVAAHASSFGATAGLMSILGDDNEATVVTEQVNAYNIRSHCFIHSKRVTTLKTRFLVGSQKMVRISRMDDAAVSEDQLGVTESMLAETVNAYDGVIFADFGCGFLKGTMFNRLKQVLDVARIDFFADAQCSSQTNTLNKYAGARLLTPTEKEARISVGDFDSTVETIAHKLLDQTNAENLILKLGPEGFIVYSRSSRHTTRRHFPSLSVNPIDVTGAGDSLFAIVSLGLMSGASITEAAALGVIAAKLAVESIGNQPINLGDIRNFIKELDGF